jgi:uncharacterized protein YbaP (TraB family)
LAHFILPKPFYPLPAAVQNAYQQADTLAVEVDASDPQFSRKMMPLLTYAAPDKLENHRAESDLGKHAEIVRGSAAQFQSLKPAMVATGLMIGIVAAAAMIRRRVWICISSKEQRKTASNWWN